ncbi:MAG: hypothetical protein OXQ92_04945 [Boseongicola sp.]|nr:hypothetical protein [Boseongicola sp.]MDD9977405.1 hypothetical protein [Boseongicola sp.]
MEQDSRLDTLAELMATQLRVRSGAFSDVVERAGRKIPKRYRGDVQTLLSSQQLASHPKLARQVNKKSVKKAERRLTYFLNKQNPKAERRNEILDVVAKIAFVFVVVVLGVFFLLLSRGYFD